MSRLKVAESLEAEGYTVFLCVGVRGDGSVRTSAVRGLRDLSEATCDALKDGFLAALDKMRHAPLDDLELR